MSEDVKAALPPPPGYTGAGREKRRDREEERKKEKVQRERGEREIGGPGGAARDESLLYLSV